MTTTSSRRRAAARLLTVPAAALLLAACGADTEPSTGTAAGSEAASSDEPLVIYSGRNENLVGGLLDQLEEAVGTPVEVRYGDSAELAAQLLEEGDATEADLFFSQDAGALGALGREGRLAELEDGVADVVDERFRDEDGRWVAVSARARVLAYDPAQVPEIDEIDEVDDLLDPRYRGKIGFAPTNASFQAFVTALRVQEGEDGAGEWLTAFAANEPVAMEKNGVVLDAVDSGEVSLGLINHYYWFEKVAELGADQVSAKIHYLDNDDPGALINVAGAGVVEGSEQSEAAGRALEFLLSDTAQEYFADETAEYPVVEGVTSTEHDLVPLDELEGASVDLNDLDSLEETLVLLDEVGLT